MSGETKIEWSDFTWNPTRGCSRITPGCGGANHRGGCYAEKIAARFSGPGQPFEGYAERTDHGGRWTGKLGLVDDMLELPLRWRKPRRIFVNSMSDLFHENLPDEAIDRVFAVMATAPQHTYQILTKRSARMRKYMTDGQSAAQRISKRIPGTLIKWPLPQVWLGVSVEDQQRADERIPDLLSTPAAVRFLSCEPLLGPVDLSRWLDRTVAGRFHAESILDWAIVGGESGPRSRSFMLSWPTSIIRQCRDAGVACFVKQLGAEAYDDRSYLGSTPRFETKNKKGGDWLEWPSDLRVREFPTVGAS